MASRKQKEALRLKSGPSSSVDVALCGVCCGAVRVPQSDNELPAQGEGEVKI